MEVKKTEKGTKKFTKAEKLLILSEAKSNGVMITLDKYDLYPGTYYYWKRKFEANGESGLDHKRAKDQETEIKRLERENEALKLLLAEKQLEGRLKDDLLKKKYPELKRKI